MFGLAHAYSDFFQVPGGSAPRRFPTQPKEKHMYALLVRLMLFATLAHLGLDLSREMREQPTGGLTRLHEASKAVSKVAWKPISVFPEEAKRFR